MNIEKQNFKLIPAVDLLDGKVVRLYQGDYSKSQIYGEDPTEPIKKFIEAGASLIHVVDLNAARNKDRSVNHDAVQKILNAAKSKAMIEIGGGIRSMDDLHDCITQGVGRCIIGTAAVREIEFVGKAITTYGADKIIVGVDAKDGTVRVSGWEKDSNINAVEFALTLEKAGVREIIFTDIATDGAMSGPSVDALCKLLKATSLRVVASGGISSIEDIKKLLMLREPNLVGAISGRAIYEGKLDVRESLDFIRTYR